jgi:hypothetical protein
VALGRRLRDQGFLTPRIARLLGDALSEAKLEEEAVRTYSEIVEFDPHSIASRRLLGDIYLGHGWYDPAYRQYRTITEQEDTDALGWLRLAAAAAGSGRVDEALRLERKVASDQGTPGPNDPRRWARLHSAARLARLLSDPAQKQSAESIERKLKELQLITGPGVLTIATWERLGADLVLSTEIGGTEVDAGEHTDAARAGLSARLLTEADAQRATLALNLRSSPERAALPVRLERINWNGARFEVAAQKIQLPKTTTRLAL